MKHLKLLCDLLSAQNLDIELLLDLDVRVLVLQKVEKRSEIVAIRRALQVEGLVGVPVVQELVLLVHVEGTPHSVERVSIALCAVDRVVDLDHYTQLLRGLVNFPTQVSNVAKLHLGLVMSMLVIEIARGWFLLSSFQLLGSILFLLEQGVAKDRKGKLEVLPLDRTVGSIHKSLF